MSILCRRQTKNHCLRGSLVRRHAASGDMGFTTGPWEAKGDINDEKPSGYGHFVTVWKKQADGSWKFVVDLGISHPQSGGPQAHCGTA